MHDWSDVITCEDVDEKVDKFHNFITAALDKHFPEKTVKISNLDKEVVFTKVKVNA